MLDVTVKRSEWLHGGEPSALYRDGRRCCLGFAGLACGLTDKDINYVLTPAGFAFDEGDPRIVHNKFLKGLPALISPTGADSAICVQLMDINDSRDISDEDQEAQLTELGKEAGINFTFVD